MSKMPIIMLLMMPFIALGAHEHILHVGNDFLYLNSEKNTIPSLNVKIGDNVFFANMSTCPFKINSDSERELHVSYENKEYYVFDDTSDLYEFDENANLIGANPCLYLESTGTQYIDTGFMPNNNTRIIISCLVGGDAGWLFGTRTGLWTINSFSVLFGAGNGNNIRSDYHPNCEKSYVPNQSIYNKKFIIDKNMNITDIYDENVILLFNAVCPSAVFQSPKTLILFGLDNMGTIVPSPKLKVYSFWLYDNGNLVRHFVPVPAGMVIGDYVVPSNGMWDIVEQKFYGNSGTGNFIYGID